jgi:hypothetical protein
MSVAVKFWSGEQTVCGVQTYFSNSIWTGYFAQYRNFCSVLHKSGVERDVPFPGVLDPTRLASLVQSYIYGSLLPLASLLLKRIPGHREKREILSLTAQNNRNRIKGKTIKCEADIGFSVELHLQTEYEEHTLGRSLISRNLSC